MKRREYLAAAGIAAGTALTGCLGSSTGTLATQVTTQPGDIGDFASCLVTFSELRVMKGTPKGDGTMTDERQTLESESGTVEGEQAYEVADAEVDLVQMGADDAKLIDERELETGEYQYLKLLVSDIDATLEGGERAEVRTPGGAPLKFDDPFEVRAGSQTVFTAAVTIRQNSDGEGYVLRAAD